MINDSCDLAQEISSSRLKKYSNKRTDDDKSRTLCLSESYFRLIFESMDLDGDGELSPEDELRSALSELIGERHMQDILIVSMRRNRNGSIDFDDFRTITQMKFEDGDKAQVDDIPNRLLRAKLVEKFAGSDAGAMSKYDWRKDFNTIDLDGDGNLQLSEIVQVLRGVLGVDDN